MDNINELARKRPTPIFRKKEPFIYHLSYDASEYGKKDPFGDLVTLFGNDVICKDTQFCSGLYVNGKLQKRVQTFRPVETSWLFKSYHTVDNICKLLQQQMPNLHYVLSKVYENKPYFAFAVSDASLQDLDTKMDINIDEAVNMRHFKDSISRQNYLHISPSMYHFSYDIPNKEYMTEEIIADIVLIVNEEKLNMNGLKVNVEGNTLNADELFCGEPLLHPVRSTILFFSKKTLFDWARYFSTKYPKLKYILSEVKILGNTDVCHVNVIE